MLDKKQPINNKKIKLSEISLYIGAVAIIIIFEMIGKLIGRNFLTFNNIQNIITQSAVISVIAIGASIVILTGGIDLSIGSVVAFVGIFIGLLIKSGFSVVVACILSALVGILFGIINGVLVNFGKVPAFITTLGTMQIARGLALLLNKGRPVSGFPDSLNAIMNTRLYGIPISVFYVFVLYAIMVVIMNYTKYGRRVFAFGGNPKAAKLSGINTHYIEISVYAISGLFAALGGIMLVSRLAYADPNAGAGYEMNAIAATVIGGISLSGGRGKIINTLVGSLILGTITCGLQIMNVQNYFQTIITGVVIVLAVFFDKSKERKAE